LEDFFGMTKFDCLIRPISYYSSMVELIGNFKIVIYPEDGTWIEKDRLIIDKVKIITNYDPKFKFEKIA